MVWCITLCKDSRLELLASPSCGPSSIAPREAWRNVVPPPVSLRQPSDPVLMRPGASPSTSGWTLLSCMWAKSRRGFFLAVCVCGCVEGVSTIITFICYIYVYFTHLLFLVIDILPGSSRRNALLLSESDSLRWSSEHSDDVSAFDWSNTLPCSLVRELALYTIKLMIIS